MYKTITFKLKTAPQAQIVINIEEKIPEQVKVSAAIKKQLEKACLDTFNNWTGRMGVQCYDVNKEFVKRLADEEQRRAFKDYNNLHATGVGVMPMEHNLVQLRLDEYYIGVDVAAEQYRKSENKEDNVVAEITIASSQENLLKLLRARLKMRIEDQLIENYIQRSPRLLAALQKGLDKEVSQEEIEEAAIEEAKPIATLTAVKPSSCHCAIL